MKKLMTGIAVAALCLSMSMVAFAANPSTTATEAKAEGYAVTTVAEPVAPAYTEAKSEAKLVAAAEAAGIKDAKVAETPSLTVEISATTAVATADGKYEVKLIVPALGEGKTYVYVHLKDDGTTESGVVTVKSGAVDLTLSGLSPVSFFEVTSAATATTATSPKTADAPVAMAMILVIAAGAGLAAISRKKAY